MKIRVINKSYDDVMAIPREKHKKTYQAEHSF